MCLESTGRVLGDQARRVGQSSGHSWFPSVRAQARGASTGWRDSVPWSAVWSRVISGRGAMGSIGARGRGLFPISTMDGETSSQALSFCALLIFNTALQPSASLSWPLETLALAQATLVLRPPSPRMDARSAVQEDLRRSGGSFPQSGSRGHLPAALCRLGEKGSWINPTPGYSQFRCTTWSCCQPLVVTHGHYPRLIARASPPSKRWIRVGPPLDPSGTGKIDFKFDLSGSIVFLFHR